MFEELNAHRQAVQENIKKAFEIGFTGNDIEKAKQWQVGDEATDKHGVTYYVHALNAAGKPLWRKKKDSGANANNSSSTGRGNNSVKSSSSEQAVDISKIPDKEFKRITNMLEKQNPLAKDAPRYLEEEAMSDSELKNFLACAEHFKNDTKNINQLTRHRCSEWAKLAKSELDDRRQSKKDAPKTQKPGQQQTKMKVDDTTIDQTEYDKAYKTATSATETEEHLKSSLAKIEENIKTIKNALADASDATAGKLQNMLTASVSKKKAIEDALKAKKKDSGAKATQQTASASAPSSASSKQAVDAGSITLKITNNGYGVVKLSDSVNAKWQDVKDEDFGGRIIGIKIDGKLGAKAFPYSFDSMKRKKYKLYTFEEAKAEAEKYLNNEKLKLTQQG